METFKITDSNGTDKTSTHKTEILFVDLGKKLQLVIEPNEDGLEIRVYPRTKGEYWDAPYDTFEINFSDIKECEKDQA